MKKLTLVLIITIIALSTGFFLMKTDVGKNIASKTLSTTIPTPTPFAFQELTIPYLRTKTFDGKLTELNQISQNGNYTSYLTSYSSDGLKVNGLLTIPNQVRPEGGWPAIVFIHGYIPPTQYATTGEAYSAYVDYLARNGFVVFKIDLRGYGDSEGQSGGGYYGSDYVTDALNAYNALQNFEFVNPNEIGMWGHSMAGNVLLRSAAVKKDIPALVIWAGAVYSYEDQRKYGIDDNSYRPPQSAVQMQNRRRELFEKNGSPSADSPFWQKVAPTNFLSDIQGAIEIHHAQDDSVVNIGYSRDLIDLLDNTQVEHKLYEYPSGGHNLAGSSFTTAMQRTVEFFKSHLSK